jgi:hypothetical protein
MTMKSILHLPAWGMGATAYLGLAVGNAAFSQPEESDGTGVPFLGYESRPWIDYRATTPFEGHARGLSEIIRASAAYNRMTAEAMDKMTEAARKDMRNREEWTHTYFRLREANRTYREKEQRPPPSMEDIVRYAQMGKPERLSPGELDTVSGRIAWPEVLQADGFTNDRERLEDLFVDWIHYGSLSLEHRQEIHDTTDAMLDELQERIHKLPPADYMAARRFLEGLAYEAYLAAG